MRGSTGLLVVAGALMGVTGGEILAHGPLTRTDRRVEASFAWITETRSTHLAVDLANIGRPALWCLIIGVLALVVALLRRTLAPLLGAAVGLGVVGIGTLVLKALFPHPTIVHHQPGSFPSGHTGVAVVGAGLLIRLLWPTPRHRETVALVAAGVWGALMGWGRLVLEAHWLSDVIGGWALGMVALILALRTVDSPPGIREWARSAQAYTRSGRAGWDLRGYTSMVIRRRDS